MRRNIIETIMGGIVILVALFFVIFAFNSSGVSTVDGYEITAEFDDATGLAPGTDVRMAGVKIGTVVEQRLNPETFFAQVVLNIDENIKLPVGTSARIISDGLLGGNFVSLTPGGMTPISPPVGKSNTPRAPSTLWICWAALSSVLRSRAAKTIRKASCSSRAHHDGERGKIRHSGVAPARRRPGLLP